jgi:hypothetical protein
MTGRAPLKNFVPAVLLLALSCIEPFEPIVDQSALNTLVVDGFINATDYSATVRLSHPQSLPDMDLTVPETNANVSISSSSGASYSLKEGENGEYRMNDFIVDKAAFYTLHIKTLSGVEYISDTIRIRSTPPIDSIGFTIPGSREFLNIHVNTHDVVRNTRYYAWDFTETYEYNAADSSEFKLVKKEVIPRPVPESIFTCWRTDRSTLISIGTSAGLKDDMIHRHVITQIPKGSPKLSVRYSVFVRQRALSVLEYTFLNELKKTTENLGGIFGTTPFPVIGNMRRVDDTEPVLGYFSGAEVTEKRFFIDSLNLPTHFRTLPSKEGCFFEETCNIFPDPLTSGPQSCVAIENLSTDRIIIRFLQENSSYIFTSSECGDCRKQGGTTKKPEFW